MTKEQKINKLAEKILWAMNHLNIKGSGMIQITKPDGEWIIKHWKQDFKDALIECGFKFEEEA